MPDNLTKRGPPDADRINVNEPWEVTGWSKHFGVTADTLRAAVAKVGVMTKDVARHLGKKWP